MRISNILQFVRERSAVKKFLENSGWIVGQNVITLLLGLFVSAITARYLGPKSFGEFSFAFSILSLFSFFATLGMDTIVVKDLIDKPKEEGTVLWTGFVMRIVGGIALTLLGNGLIFVVSPADMAIRLLVLILSIGIVFRAFEIIECWTTSHQKSRISAKIRIVVYCVTSVLKVTVFVAFHASVYVYAMLFILDALMIGALLSVAFFKSSTRSPLRFSYSYAKRLISQCWYIALTGFLGSLYLRIDQVMIGSMLSDKAQLGIYSVAVRMAELWFFVPMAIITSLQPIIMRYKSANDEANYRRTLEALYALVTWIGIIACTFITLCSSFIIHFLYGPTYSDAAGVLSISVWAGTFTTLGAARMIWLVSENLQKYTVLYAVAGALVNVLLNMALIPVMGIYGAATASLVTQFFCHIVFLSFFKQTRISTGMILRAFALSIVFDWLRRNKGRKIPVTE
ncbi:flippase [Cohnella sp. GCM10027633]|uniref:flippase n=1 Tax=unclassified Cohnella TaxID=2636738 RepID=UPI0036443945